jgi:hypothetical protein
MGWKVAVYTYPWSIVYDIHGEDSYRIMMEKFRCNLYEKALFGFSTAMSTVEITIVLNICSIVLAWVEYNGKYSYRIMRELFRCNLYEKALFGFSTAIIALPLLNSIFIPNFRDPEVNYRLCI